MELLFVAYEKNKNLVLFFFLADMSKKVLEFKQHLIFYVNTFMTSLETPSADKNHYKKKKFTAPKHTEFICSIGDTHWWSLLLYFKFPLMDERWQRK